jgi:carbon storage regulator
MLVLSRKEGQRIHIGSDVVVTVLTNRRGQVRLGIEAPRDVVVLREEAGKKDARILSSARPS